MTNISLIETFNDSSWMDYSTYDPNINLQLTSQEHIDIRTFAVDSGEKWVLSGTGSTYGSLASYNHLPGLTLNCSTGLNTAISTVVGNSVDLFDGFEDTDFISLALPAFPSEVNLTSSNIQLTSSNGQTASVPLSASLIPLIGGSSIVIPSIFEEDDVDFIIPTVISSTPVFAQDDLDFIIPESTSGVSNGEFRVYRSAFDGIDFSSVLTVQFNVVASGACTFYAMGFRLLNANWEYGSIDFDNWNDRLVYTTPTNGIIPTAPEFSTPIFWKSSAPAGPQDPRPINSTFNTIFNTGSQNGANSLTLYFRETPKAFLTQLDLNLMNQGQLNDLGGQPDLGVSEYSPRNIGSLDGLTMVQLDGQTMLDLEAIYDPVYTGWIQFQLQWGSTNQASITNSSQTSGGYIYPGFATTGGSITLLNNHYYTLVTSITNTEVRFAIYDMNQSTFGLIQTPIFDTEIIDDDFIFVRRAGRFGWTASIADGDAYVSSIRPQSLSFAEYRSAPLASTTPVTGAQLFANYSNNTEYFTEFSPYPTLPISTLFGNDDLYPLGISTGGGGSGTVSAATISNDTFGGESTKVTIVGNGLSSFQGAISNVLPITNLTETEIHFDIFYPKSLLIQGNTISAELIYVNAKASNPLFINLTIPALQGDQWEHIVIYPGASLNSFPVGDWQLIIQAVANVPSVWYIQNVSIFERAIRWTGRAVVDDPWHDNYAPWTPFKETINTNTGGATFLLRGTDLQMRAEALRQDAYISGTPSLIPKYAQLGRLVWPEDQMTGITPPILGSPITSGTGLSVTFLANVTTPGTGQIVLYEWDFGDGASALGSRVSHTYATHGEFFATLTVTDFYGNRVQTTVIVTT